MTFKEQMLADLEVFINTAEFAETVDWNGQEPVAIPAADEGKEREEPGVNVETKALLFKTADLPVPPVAHEENVLNGEVWTTLKQVLEDIAARHGVSAKYDSGKSIDFQRLDQREQSDLQFLKTLGDRWDHAVRVASGLSVILAGELVGETISEAGLVDAAGNLLAVKNFAPKIKENDEQYEIEIKLNF